MRRVNARPHRNVAGNSSDNFRHFFEPAADHSPLPGGVFNENLQAVKVEAARRLPQRFDAMSNCLRPAAVPRAPGMRDEIFSSKSPRPLDFAPEGRDRHRPQPLVLRSEINQVVIMDDERCKAVLPSRRPKTFAILRRRLF